MSQARKRDASQMDALAAARLDARLLESDSSASDDDEPLASRPAPVRPMLATHTKKKPQRSLSSDDDVRSRAAPASATAAGGDSHNSDVEVIGETIVSKHPKPMAKHTKQKKPQSQKNKVAAASAAKKTKQTAAAAAAASSSSDAAAATSGSKRRKLDSGAAKKSILKRAPVPMPSAESADDSDGSSASRSAASSRDPSPAAKPAAAGKGKTGRPTSKTYRAPVVVNGEATWTVQSIAAEDRDSDGREVFLVKWAGFQHVENTWEPRSSVASCDLVLADWQKEKMELAAQQLFGKRGLLEPPAAAAAAAFALNACPVAAVAAAAAAMPALANFAFTFPIYDRHAKHKVGKRSWASDQAWLDRAIAREKASAEAAAERAKRAAAEARAKKMRAAHLARKAGLKESQLLESKAARQAREELERADREAISEINRLKRQAELDSSEPYYFVVADDSILMDYLDSSEEEEWGVEKRVWKGKKAKSQRPNAHLEQPAKPATQVTPAAAAAASSSSAAAAAAAVAAPAGGKAAAKAAKAAAKAAAAAAKATSGREKRPRKQQRAAAAAAAAGEEEHKSPPIEIDMDGDTEMQPAAAASLSSSAAAAAAAPASSARGRSRSRSPSPEPRGGRDASGYSKPAAPSELAIRAEEWSDEDLEVVGDGRGADAKEKAYFAQRDVREVMDILERRPRNMQMAAARAAAAAATAGGASPAAAAAAASSSAAAAASASSSSAPARPGSLFDYFVRWKDRSRSWEPEENLVGCQAKLNAFLAAINKGQTPAAALASAVAQLPATGSAVDLTTETAVKTKDEPDQQVEEEQKSNGAVKAETKRPFLAMHTKTK